MHPLWLDLEPESGTRAVPLPWAWHHRELQALRHKILMAHNGQLPSPPPPYLSPGAEWRPQQPLPSQALPSQMPLSDLPSLADVDAALGRIRHGSYGLCEETGLPIPPELLEATPWVHCCPRPASRLPNLPPEP